MHDRAGTTARPEDLVDVDALLTAYAERRPDVSIPAQRVAFGTSGHRGSSLDTAFTEAHIAAITQAVIEVRAEAGIDGPVYVGSDTHALSAPAERTVLEVLAAADVPVLGDPGTAVPTPAVSRAIIARNRRGGAPADGIVITPSHNPPRDGGIKYNPPHGGPADTDLTKRIESRANELLAGGTVIARDEPVVRPASFLAGYVRDLAEAVDIDAIRSAGVRIGADPMGGAAVHYWAAIRDELGLAVTVVDERVDPTWAFMPLDWDGRIRMDPSSPHAMAGLLRRVGDGFDVLTGNDADADRHGIVTPDAGLMNPNHFLAVAIDYLLSHRPDWPLTAAIGKTLVSSSIIDRVVAAHGRPLLEVPVGFKWFVPGLSAGSIVFGGEESAGASFLQRNGQTWTTDKDGILLDLLAAEIIAVTGQSPSQRYRELTRRFGDPVYTRVDAPATKAQKAALARLSAADVRSTTLAGEPIRAVLTEAPGNGAPLGGLKVVTDSAWFAARPSGTEDVAKIYAESFMDEAHLARVVEEAQALVAEAVR